MTSKAARHNAILDLLRARPIHTQAELTTALRQRRLRVTQATVSRDLRELGVVRGSDAGRVRYRAPELPAPASTRLAEVLATYVRAGEAVGTMVVLHTPPGCAPLVASALDRDRLGEVVGTVAGDDTIFVQTRSVRGAARFLTRLGPEAAPRPLMEDPAR
ncbi:MAG TPA: arginine repressor [Candidatus Dormibacteraeota bacterium]|nr:arginine repressor [Candidatus Dormibacteraeota bacterium]